MRIAYVSTFGQQCGIATYTEELCTAMVSQNIAAPTVLAPAEAGVGLREVPGIPWRSCWSRNGHLLSQLEGFLRGVDVLHVQHEDGLFRNPSALFGMLHTVKETYPKLLRVVTLHTVRPYGDFECSGFYDALVRTVDVIIVHTVEALASVAQARGRTARLRYIPHGTAVMEPPPPRDVDARVRGLKLLNITVSQHVERILADEVTVGLVQGFQGPSKNTVATIRAFAVATARRLITKSILVVSGEAYDPSWWGVLSGVANATGYADRILVSTGFTQPHNMAAVMAAADYGVLNTNAWVLSSSGAAHMFAAHGVPLTCANRPIYHEAIQGGAIPFWLNEQDVGLPSLSMVNALAALASDSDVRKTVRYELLSWATRTAWERIARRHLEVYEGA